MNEGYGSQMDTFPKEGYGFRRVDVTPKTAKYQYGKDGSLDLSISFKDDELRGAIVFLNAGGLTWQIGVTYFDDGIMLTYDNVNTILLEVSEILDKLLGSLDISKSLDRIYFR